MVAKEDEEAQVDKGAKEDKEVQEAKEVKEETADHALITKDVLKSKKELVTSSSLKYANVDGCQWFAKMHAEHVVKAAMAEQVVTNLPDLQDLTAPDLQDPTVLDHQGPTGLVHQDQLDSQDHPGFPHDQQVDQEVTVAKEETVVETEEVVEAVVVVLQVSQPLSLATSRHAPMPTKVTVNVQARVMGSRHTS